MRVFVGLCGMALLAGCNVILGVDQDYVVGADEGTQTGSAPTGTRTGSTSTGSATTTGGGGSGQGGSPTATPTGTGGSSTGTATGVLTVTYPAAVADCIDTSAPDPDACADPTDALWIDQPTTEAFIRFDTDGTIAGATIVGATMLLTVGTYSQAQGDTSGELWETAAFTRSDLYTGAPATVGDVLIPNQGPVDPGTTVSWQLPTSLVSADSSIFLGLVPTSYNSVGYLNLDGSNPPQLVVEYR